jgi:hypothetical protein
MFRRKPKQRRRSSSARFRRIQLESLEQRRLLAANPLGVTPMDTGEFLLGSIGVTPVFFESDGGIDTESQNWTTEEIDQVLAKVGEGVNWWSDTLDTLNTVHTLDFVIDDTFAVDPVETPYEPIDRSSSTFNEYVGAFLTSQGFGDADSIGEAVQRFNVAQREKLQTDWAFTIFVVDSSDDPDGLFAAGGNFSAAFAFAGGLFMVTPSTRPAPTIAHEMGHIFWARDEYSGGGSWTDTRGYYNAQNLNASDNPTPGFEQQISVLRGGVPLTAAYQAHVSPESTLAMVGWRDSDGDGVFDLADVPLHLDGTGYFDADSSLYHFAGSASAVPMINQNSSGAQSDITLNRVSQLQYSLDGGPWRIAAQPDQQVVEFDLSLTIDQPFSTIQWRAIDLATGIVSPTIAGTAALPALSTSSLSGLAFVDDNSNGKRDLGEAALSLTDVIVRGADGSPLFSGEVNAVDFTDGELPGELAGVAVGADGTDLSGKVGSFSSQAAGDQQVFHAFDTQRNSWVDRWSGETVFEASFDSSVGEVRLGTIGLDETSFARLEAYDAAGKMLARVTSDAIGSGQSSTLPISDSGGRIASIRALGHANTAVAISDLWFGFEDSAVTDLSGAWSFKNLPDGDYLVDIVPERLIHQLDQSSVAVEVAAGTSELMEAAATRVDSPRHNQLLAGDANGDGQVTANDALVIINDIVRHRQRVLQASDPTAFDVDVSNDGFVSTLDALLVINTLARKNGGVGEYESNISARSVQSVSFIDNADGIEDKDGSRLTETHLPLRGESLAAPKNHSKTAISAPEGESLAADRPSEAPESEQSIIPITAEISEPFCYFVI